MFAISIGIAATVGRPFRVALWCGGQSALQLVNAAHPRHVGDYARRDLGGGRRNIFALTIIVEQLLSAEPTLQFGAIKFLGGVIVAILLVMIWLSMAVPACPFITR